MPRKINPSYKCCEENYKRKNNPIKQEIGASCFYNLFAHCWYEDKDDLIVIRALEGNESCKRELHTRLKEDRQ